MLLPIWKIPFMNLPSSRLFTYSLALALLVLPQIGVPAKDSNLEAARAAAAAQKWEVAIEKAQAVLGRNPKSVEALQILGESQIALGDTLDGMKHLRRALSIKPQDTVSLVLLVDALLYRGEVDDADRFVSAAEAEDRQGRLWEVKASRARVLAAQGQITDAIRILAEATVKNPENPLYPTLLARIYSDKKIYELAIDNYRHAITLSPEDAQLRFELAQLLLKNKQFNEAMDEFKIVRDADPTNTEVNYQIGRLYFAAGRYTEALEPLKASAQDRSDHFYSFYLLGKTYYILKLPAEALEPLQKAHHLQPQHREVQVLLASALAEEEKYTEEIKFLRSVLSDSATDAELLVIGADAYYNLTSQDTDPELKTLHYDSALALYKRSLAAAPAQPRITYRVATVHYNNDQLDSAIVYYQKTLKLQPEKCGAIINMGYCYGRLQKWAEAIAALRRGIACETSNIPARTYLASILAAQDSLVSAIEIYTDVVNLDSTNCEAYGQMGLIYFNREQYLPAIRNLTQAVAFCPDRGDFWSLYGYSNWSHFLKIRQRIRDSHDGLIPGDELWSEGGKYLEAAERGFEKALLYMPNDKSLKETCNSVTDYKKRLGGK